MNVNCTVKYIRFGWQCPYWRVDNLRKWLCLRVWLLSVSIMLLIDFAQVTLPAFPHAKLWKFSTRGMCKFPHFSLVTMQIIWKGITYNNSFIKFIHIIYILGSLCSFGIKVLQLNVIASSLKKNNSFCNNATSWWKRVKRWDGESAAHSRHKLR